MCRFYLDIQRVKTVLKFTRVWKLWYIQKYYSAIDSDVGSFVL